MGISGPPTSGPTGGLRREFGEVKAVAGMIVEEEVQDALRAAGESLKKDGSELERDPFGREARKRRSVQIFNYFGMLGFGYMGFGGVCVCICGCVCAPVPNSTSHWK